MDVQIFKDEGGKLVKLQIIVTNNWLYSKVRRLLSLSNMFIGFFPGEFFFLFERANIDFVKEYLQKNDIKYEFVRDDPTEWIKTFETPEGSYLVETYRRSSFIINFNNVSEDVQINIRELYDASYEVLLKNKDVSDILKNIEAKHRNYDKQSKSWRISPKYIEKFKKYLEKSEIRYRDYSTKNFLKNSDIIFCEKDSERWLAKRWECLKKN